MLNESGAHQGKLVESWPNTRSCWKPWFTNQAPSQASASAWTSPASAASPIADRLKLETPSAQQHNLNAARSSVAQPVEHKDSAQGPPPKTRLTSCYLETLTAQRQPGWFERPRTKFSRLARQQRPLPTPSQLGFQSKKLSSRRSFALRHDC